MILWFLEFNLNCSGSCELMLGGLGLKTLTLDARLCPTRRRNAWGQMAQTHGVHERGCTCVWKLSLVCSRKMLMCQKLVTSRPAPLETESLVQKRLVIKKKTGRRSLLHCWLDYTQSCLSDCEFMEWTESVLSFSAITWRQKKMSGNWLQMWWEDSCGGHEINK